MPFSNEFDTAFFSKASNSFKQKSRTAFKREETSFEQEVQKNLLNFEEIERKGIHIKAMQKGQFTATMSGFSIDDFYALMCETNPLAEFRIAEDSDLDFSETYCDFIPEEGLIKHSNVPLWIISPVSAENVGETTAAKAQNVVRISRVWR